MNRDRQHSDSCLCVVPCCVRPEARACLAVLCGTRKHGLVQARGWALNPGFAWTFGTAALVLVEHVQFFRVKYSCQKRWHTEPVSQ